MSYTKSMTQAIAAFAAEGRAVVVCPPARATGMGKFTPTKSYQRPTISTRWFAFYNDEISRLTH